MIGLHRETLPRNLPAAACTEDTYDQVRQFAKDQNTSMSAVIRAAVALFLEKNDSKTRINNSNSR